VGTVGAEVGPTCAAKYTESGVIGCGTKKTMKGHVICKEFSRGAVDEVCGREERMVPIF
jgi:hypothetical protein